ncbi:MAG TPA: hypothetical protein ENJ90_00890 [Devosia sp.]|nr:hypothetical protein [Devosia sp.]
MPIVLLRILAALALLLLPLSQSAFAKPARCFTTDDGYYNCEFTAIQGDGSFIISAKGRPTFTLYIEGPGVASGFADFGTGRNVPLPGPFYRSKQDGACWISSATNTAICAW